MKDEMAGDILTEVVGLRAMMYGIESLNGKVEKKAKGVPKSMVKRSVHFEHYKKCLFEHEKVMTQFYTLRSREHEIHTERVTKIVLSSDDNKRYLLRDGSHETLAWGHVSIPEKGRLVT